MDLETRLSRDTKNAETAQRWAQGELATPAAGNRLVDIATGITEAQRQRRLYGDARLQSLHAIQDQPFHAMVEVVSETRDGAGKYTEQEQLWYANERVTSNTAFSVDGTRIAVLSWTHPGLQLALTRELNEYHEIQALGLTLVGVQPLARAKFDAVLPRPAGIYDPGGSVGVKRQTAAAAGLKAVKLNMTRQQAEAFISRMSGTMIVTGAPGSGKTTVALQRVRFLLDQQDLLRDTVKVEYSPHRTKVFIANPNLVTYTKRLLQDELLIPESTVELIDPFITRYLDDLWRYKHDARLRQRVPSPLELRARQAFFGLCYSRDLRALWRDFEAQIVHRFAGAASADWTLDSSGEGYPGARDLAGRLAALAGTVKPQDEPRRSRVSMEPVYRDLRAAYARLRDTLNTRERQRFDDVFMRWLYWVYDPLAAVSSYFTSRLSEGAARIRKGTASLADENQIIQDIRSDWSERRYGPEERPWLAWLLRFALPETFDPQERFREIPSALFVSAEDDRWSHVVIDEAQDLSAPQASLLGALVHPDGAVTLSADFRQVVSPVHGMIDASAFEIGNPLRSGTAQQIYPFARNLRQSREIGLFLQGFFHAAFGEISDFEPSDNVSGQKPLLLIGSALDHARRIQQLLNVLQRSSVTSVALLQIDENEESLLRLRSMLERQGVVVAPLWEPRGGGLITTSVERIKGLEFDACFVVGLENVERSSLNFTRNRAYVALSRPTRRLAIVCEEFPSLLRKVDPALFETR